MEAINSPERTASIERFFREEKVLEKITRIVCFQVNGSCEDREDLISEIVKVLLMNLRRGLYIPEKATFNAYLRGIIRHKISDYFRRKKFTSFSEVQEPAYEGRSEKLLLQAEEKQRLRKSIHKLERKYQSVIILRYYQQAGIAEIAEQLNLDERKVYNRIHYGLRKLRDYI